MASNSASSVRFGFPAWFVNLVATVQVGAAMRLASGTLVRIHLTTPRELRVEDIPGLVFDKIEDVGDSNDITRTLLMSGTITASDRIIFPESACSVIHVVPPASQNCRHPANCSLDVIN